MTVAFRTMLDRDRKFVVSAWAQSYRDSDSAGMICLDDWHPVMRAQINKVLDRQGVTTYIAFETADPESTLDIYGFVVADIKAKLVWFVYTKHAYRRSGIARRLFRAVDINPNLPFRFVCRTGVVPEIYEARKIPHAKWDPMAGRTEPRSEP